ncbi:MAG: YgaP family membrane protein [Actinomycetota bacterium]
MERNEAGVDRVVRGVVAVAAAVAAFAVGPTSGAGIALVAVAVVMAATAASGFCPLYRLFGISTCRVPTAK